MIAGDVDLAAVPQNDAQLPAVPPLYRGLDVILPVVPVRLDRQVQMDVLEEAPARDVRRDVPLANGPDELVELGEAGVRERVVKPPGHPIADRHWRTSRP